MEYVQRIRGAATVDEDGHLQEAMAPVQLRAMAVFPGSSSINRDKGRDGRKIAYTVHFFPAVDLRDGDQLVVRGTTCDIVVQDWRSPRSGRRLQEVLCTSGKG
ncbi:head-to-tail stopper [Gordonia phage Upyo]|nr:head-to-tail stopper [Gordonia phage Upyo]